MKLGYIDIAHGAVHWWEIGESWQEYEFNGVVFDNQGFAVGIERWNPESHMVMVF